MGKDRLKRQDIKYMQKAAKLMQEKVGERGIQEWLRADAEINEEVKNNMHLSLPKVIEMAKDYFEGQGWPPNKITRWIEGKTSPFRRGVVDDDLAKCMLAELAFFKMAHVLLDLGLSKSEVDIFLTAKFITGRWNNHDGSSGLISMEEL